MSYYSSRYGDSNDETQGVLFRNKVSVRDLEKAANALKVDLVYDYEGGSKNTPSRIGFPVNFLDDGSPSVLFYFNVISSKLVTFDETYRVIPQRGDSSPRERRRAETYVLDKAFSGRKDINLVFKLANKMVGKSIPMGPDKLSRKEAFARAKALVQDPGSLEVTLEEREILKSYGVVVSDLKSYREVVAESDIEKKIIEAIENKRVLRIYYSARLSAANVRNTTAREIEPYVLGMLARQKRGSKEKGNIKSKQRPKERGLYTLHLAVRAYQLKGPTGTGWRMFKLENITRMEILPKNFDRPQALYNPSGDEGLSDIKAQAKF